MGILVYSEPCAWVGDGGIRKESDYVQKNAPDIRTQLHTAQEENATNQVSMAHLMNFTNGQFKNLHEANEVGNKQTNLLARKTMDMSKVMGEKTIGNFETKEQTMGRAQVKLGLV